jgi:hypothetical protein
MHQPWGKKPVGPVEQVQAVVVLAGEQHAGAVGLELRGGEERLLGVLLALGDVVHRHRRAGVPGVALQDVDGQPELGQAGQLGVPEPVRAAQPDRPPLAVGDLDDIAELAQHPGVGARRVGLGGGAVAQALSEQEAWLDVGKPLPDPLLLLLDDLCDLAVNEDVVRCGLDLGLGVVEARDLLVVGDGVVGTGVLGGGGGAVGSGDRQSNAQVRAARSCASPGGRRGRARAARNRGSSPTTMPPTACGRSSLSSSYR